jgi:RNA polymerase sigma factor (sigma-70 family)
MAETVTDQYDERELLRRYVKAGDAEAFRILVELHRDMVYSVCQRILRNEADAEDAAQDSFLQFARKASVLEAPVAGWLHQVALHLSMDMRKRNAQREKREAYAAHVRDTVSDPNWEDVREFVDEAVANLPEHLRIPVVLHYLERRTQSEIAAQLSLTQSAVSRRLSQGVAVMHNRLARIGILVPAAALATLLTANGVEAAPPTLMSEIGRIALAGLAGSSGAAGGTTATAGGLSIMKIGVACAATVCALVTGGLIVTEVLPQAANNAKPPAVVVVPAPPVDAPPAPQPPPPPQSPTQNAPPVPDKVDLRQQYPLGNFVTVNEAEGEQRVSAEGSVDITQSLSQAVTILMQVEKAGENGERKIGVSFRKVKAKIRQGGADTVFDSEQGPSPGGTPYLSQLFRPLLEAKIVATVGADGRVTDVKGLTETWQAVAQREPGNPIAQLMKEQMGDAFIRDLIESGRRILPPNPVATGDEWRTETSAVVPFVGEVKFGQKNRLQALADAPEGRIATIQFEGQAAQGSEQKVDLGLLRATFRKMDMKQVGEAQFNATTGMIVATKVQQDGTMVMTAGEEAGIAISMNVRQSMNSRTTTREATEDDLKPVAGQPGAPASPSFATAAKSPSAASPATPAAKSAGGPPPTAGKGTTANRVPELEKALWEKVSVDFATPTGLAEIVKKLNELIEARTGLVEAIELDKEVTAIDPRRITLVLQDFPVREVLTILVMRATTDADRQAKDDIVSLVHTKGNVILITHLKKAQKLMVR